MRIFDSHANAQRTLREIKLMHLLKNHPNVSIKSVLISGKDRETEDNHETA